MGPLWERQISDTSSFSFHIFLLLQHSGKGRLSRAKSMTLTKKFMAKKNCDSKDGTKVCARSICGCHVSKQCSLGTLPPLLSHYDQERKKGMQSCRLRRCCFTMRLCLLLQSPVPFIMEQSTSSEYITTGQIVSEETIDSIYTIPFSTITSS